MNNSTYHFGHFRSEAALRAGELMLQIVLPIQLVFGTIGNVLSIIVLSRRSMQKNVSSTFLIGLAVADLLVLWWCLGRDWIRYMKDDLRNVHTWTCKISFWLQYSFLDFSIWILTSLTVERFLSTFRPFATKFVFKKWHAKRVIVALLIIDLVVHSHFLFGMELRLEHKDGIDQYACRPATEKKNYEIFYDYAWHYIDLALFCLIPFFVLLLCNAYIIFKLLYKRKKLAANSPEMTWSAAAQKTSSMTKLLIALNVIFITTTLPIDIYLVLRPYIVPKDIPTRVEDLDPWYAFVKILMYVNNSVNFILYMASGSKFRRELRNVFKRAVYRYTSSVVSSHTSPKSTPNHSVVERVAYKNRLESFGDSQLHVKRISLLNSSMAETK